MRKLLDFLYTASGVLAALFLVAIVAVVFAQVVLNLIDKIFSSFGGGAIGLTIPSYAGFTGFFLAAASFLALAYTFRSGGHIRITLVTGLLGKRVQNILEVATLIMALCMAGYASYYFVLLALESIEFGDMTKGMVSIPLWIPQSSVVLGLIILTIALIDDLVTMLLGGRPSYEGKGENLLSEK